MIFIKIIWSESTDYPNVTKLLKKHQLTFQRQVVLRHKVCFPHVIFVNRVVLFCSCVFSFCLPLSHLFTLFRYCFCFVRAWVTLFNHYCYFSNISAVRHFTSVSVYLKKTKNRGFCLVRQFSTLFWFCVFVLIVYESCATQCCNNFKFLVLFYRGFFEKLVPKFWCENVLR